MEEMNNILHNTNYKFICIGGILFFSRHKNMGGCQQSPRKLGYSFSLARNLSEQKRSEFHSLACRNWGSMNKFKDCKLPCVKVRESGNLWCNTEISSALCTDLEGWDGRVGGGEGEYQVGGIFVYIYLIHFVVQQKPTQ